ncbi:MAG TPA: hypothetical protein GX393_09535 [Firmicutes bacterium]|jgi:stage III sporulation protein AF|nr:hypothetical protein [Bacillota bacterium]
MYWRQWLQTLFSLAVLLAVLELLLPSGELAKFARLVLGLSLMLAVLEPVVLLVNEEMLGVDLTWLQGGEDAPDVQQLAGTVQWAAVRPFWDEHTGSLAAQLEDALAGLGEVEKVEVRLPASGEGAAMLEILIEPFQPRLRQEVVQLASALLNISPQHISVLPWSE